MRPRVAWLTDVHLNFVPPWEVARLVAEINHGDPCAVLISGDIGEAPSVTDYLEQLQAGLEVPIYFVLGNHDFYHGDIASVRRDVRTCCKAHERLTYLTSASPQSLTSEISLVGHDGWADGRLGDYERSLVSMTDNRLIVDFQPLNKEQRWELMQALADEAAASIHDSLDLAFRHADVVWVVTHVPPLREACVYDGQISDEQWAPFFSSKAMGDVLLSAMHDRPEQRMLVLCGHTHGGGDIRPLPNLHVLTGAAEYGEPKVFWLDAPTSDFAD